VCKSIVSVKEIIGGNIQAGGDQIIDLDVCRRAKVDPIRICKHQIAVGDQRTEDLALITACVTGQQTRRIGRQGNINSFILGNIKRTEINDGVIGGGNIQGGGIR